MQCVGYECIVINMDSIIHYIFFEFITEYLTMNVFIKATL